MNILMLGEAAHSSVMEWLSWFRSVEYQKKKGNLRGRKRSLCFGLLD